MLLFVDSCSHYTQTFLDKKWDVVSSLGTGVTQSVNTNGRNGGGAITFTGLGGSSFDSPLYIQKNYNGVSTIYIGMALQQTATQGTWGGQWLSFLSGNTVQVALSITPSGQIEVYRATTASTGVFLHPFEGGERTVLGLSTDSIASSSYDFLEVKVVHHASTGSVTIKRNGSAFYTLTNVNTNIAGTGNSASVLIGGYTVFGGASPTVALKANVTDVYLLNTTVNGSDPNDPIDFIGDRHWEVVLPTADATYTDWTPTPSANHWENVDEIPPDGITSNNSTGTVTDKDSFAMDTFTGPSTASVLLSYTIYSQKDVGGAIGVSGLMRSPAGGGGTDGNGTEFQVPNPFGFRQSFLCTDPAAPGTDPITVAIANAAEHGYERTS